MLQNLTIHTISNQLRKITHKHIAAAAILTYLVFTLPAYFQITHFFRNLEPYPDGILYSLSAKNFVEKQRFQLEYQDTSLKYWVQPLYSILLVPAYFLSSNPDVFYLTNIFLGIISTSLLCQICWKITKNKIVVALAITAFLLHGYILLLPSLPMAENASLLFFIAATYYLLDTSQQGVYRSVVSIFFSVALFMTKSAAVLIVLFLIVAAIFVLLRSVSKQTRIICLLSGAIIVLFTAFLRIDLIRVSYDSISSIIDNTNQYFSLDNVLPNLIRYLNALVLRQGDFLWWTKPLSSVPLLLVLLFTPIVLRFSKMNSLYEHSVLILGTFISQFFLLVIFYEVDTRYMIYTIPLTVIQLSILLNSCNKKTTSLAVGVICLSILTYQQRALLHEVVAANLLGRSNSWQYQGVKHFDTYLEKVNVTDAYIITALPPFFVDAYQNTEFRVLPLSQSQEFIQKQEYIWGSDITYEDLHGYYRSLIKNGESVYISNAYITHQQSVANDYEDYKAMYNFELVSEGCLSACNVYKLTLKDS